MSEMDHPVPVNILDAAEVFGRMIYDHIVTAHNGTVPDVSVLPRELSLTPQQLRDGLTWCEANDLLELFIY